MVKGLKFQRLGGFRYVQYIGRWFLTIYPDVLPAFLKLQSGFSWLESTAAMGSARSRKWNSRNATVTRCDTVKTEYRIPQMGSFEQQRSSKKKSSFDMILHSRTLSQFQLLKPFEFLIRNIWPLQAIVGHISSPTGGSTKLRPDGKDPRSELRCASIHSVIGSLGPNM